MNSVFFTLYYLLNINVIQNFIWYLDGYLLQAFRQHHDNQCVKHIR